MKRLLSSYLIIVLMAVTSISIAQVNNVKKQFPQDFKHKVYEHIINITNIGVHSAGTEEEKQAAKYILDEFDKIGLETNIENFEFESYDITKTKLRINNKKTKVLQVCFNPYTSTVFWFDEEFILLDADNSTTTDIANKIVVASFPLENMSFFSLFFNRPKLIIVISPVDFEELAKVESRNLQCKITGKNKTHYSQNIVGLIKAINSTEDDIIISAHYDSYPSSIGADDNASGVGALIELARYFKLHADQLTSNIKFVGFGGEEKGLLGSRAYLSAHANDLANCSLLFNMDQIGGEDIFIETTGGVSGIPDKIGKTQFPEYMRNRSLEGIESNWRILAPDALSISLISNRPFWLSEIIKESSEELQITASFVGNTGSDQMTFAQAGIVSTAIGTSGNEYHSPLDVPMQIHKQSLEDCSKIVVDVVFKIMKMHKNNESHTQNIGCNSTNIVEQNELMAHIRFLASDELKGRKPGSNEIKIAARYIAEQFRASGLQEFPDLVDYLQPTLLKKDEHTYKPVFCNNVVGYVEGSDSTLKKEYLLLMAHYDHLGIKKDIENPNSDSIYNGARDNAMGTTALIYAAKVLAYAKCKRSIIFLATTGEEDGMLGSKFFVDHSPAPIEEIVFVLNNDGGGYNDTTLIRVGGKERMIYPFALWAEIEKSGIKPLPYPQELEYLYDLGDNITFVRKGIPAITISPGFDKIDNEILKYVHQPADEANDDFNYSYLLKFSQVYTEIARLIANSNNVPKWKNK